VHGIRAGDGAAREHEIDERVTLLFAERVLERLGDREPARSIVLRPRGEPNVRRSASPERASAAEPIPRPGETTGGPALPAPSTRMSDAASQPIAFATPVAPLVSTVVDG
jgi:hypothetical protein